MLNKFSLKYRHSVSQEENSLFVYCRDILTFWLSHGHSNIIIVSQIVKCFVKMSRWHLERAGGMQSVYQQSPASRVRR